MHICHEHNLSRPAPAHQPYGLRISLRPGDPFASLVGADWHKEHWFATERERDAAIAVMSGRHLFFRIGDEPTLVFESVDKPATPA
jgi:hypothetical protein